ncbi:MAG: exosortase-associated EpsI family protein [Verrucomicrobia bacterium]|nr:exosortase-associated EpsI family protein [Verrucomicrobiota bacterium]
MRPRHVFLGLLLAAVGVWLACARLFPPAGSGRLLRLPLKGAGFRGAELALQPVEQAVLAGATWRKRTYDVGGQQCVLIAIDGTGNRHALHDPTYCFRGAGWEIVGQQTLALDGGEARRVQLRRGQERSEAVYWYSDGRTRQPNAWRAWTGTILQRLQLRRWSGETVLVMLQPAGARALDWPTLLRDFPELQQL